MSRDDYAQRFLDQVVAEPYGFDEMSRGVTVHRGEEVSALLVDERFWNRASVDHRLRHLSPEHQVVRKEFSAFLRQWPAFSAGPYHEVVRAILADGLGGPVREQVRDRLAVDVRLLDGLAGRRFELIQDFAWPYALGIVASMLGVGDEEAEHVARLGAVVLNTMAAVPSTVEGVRSALAAVDELREWLGRAVDAHPESRLIAALGGIWRRPDCGPLAATAAFTQVVTGTMEPMVTVLCVLAERVGEQELRDVPVPALREEVLRLATPFRFAVRYARCPVEVGGRELAEGGRVALHLGTANVDPLVRADPLELRERKPQTHLAFGLGPHYCLGTRVARAAVDEVLIHLRDRGVTFHCEEVDRAPEVPTLRYRKLVCVLG